VSIVSPAADPPAPVWGPRLVTLWLLLTAAAVLAPWLLDSPTRVEDQVRQTVRVSLLFYAAAAVLMLRLRPGDWAAGGPARWCWTLAWAAYGVHLGFAAEFHGWSHDAAVAHTDRRTGGYGHGIHVSHLFTLLWTLDVIAWWARPAAYAARPVWWGTALHAFMAFLWFNATVVYETGPIRWAGLAVFGLLAVVWASGGRQPGSVRGEREPG
jgi:hypothetical protein